MAEPAGWDIVVAEVSGRPIALFACGRRERVGEVPVTRCTNDALGRTVLVHLMADYRRQVAGHPPTALRVTDESIRPHVRSSIEAEGLSAENGGRLGAACALGFHSAADLATCLQEAWGGDEAGLGGRLHRRLSQATTSSDLLDIERFVLPGRLSGEIPTYLIPIRPPYAEALFDDRLASQSLLPRTARLGLSRENVYFRTSDGRDFVTPARILWYVSGSRKKNPTGVQSVAAVSTLRSVHVGDPEYLHARFAHLGVYDLEGLAAMGNRIQALRFGYTELLRKPVPVEELRSICAEEGHTFVVRWPSQLPLSVANRILTAGV